MEAAQRKLHSEEEVDPDEKVTDQEDNQEEKEDEKEKEKENEKENDKMVSEMVNDKSIPDPETEMKAFEEENRQNLEKDEN